MLFVGDDWAEDHHDVELMDSSGQTVARARLPEGAAGMTRLHAMIGEHLGQDGEAEEVRIGIETDRGLWVAALAAAGYTVYGINPLQASRYRERHGVSGAKSDTADAHMLADMVRTDSHQLRPVAGDSAGAQAVKVVARAHKTLIWERTRHVQRLRHQLRDYFPAALEAFEDLDAADTLELLARARLGAAAGRAPRRSAPLSACRRQWAKTAAIRTRCARRVVQPPRSPLAPRRCGAGRGHHFQRADHRGEFRRQHPDRLSSSPAWAHPRRPVCRVRRRTAPLHQPRGPQPRAAAQPGSPQVRGENCPPTHNDRLQTPRRPASPPDSTSGARA